ncbi:TPA: hypothetical protein PWZ64_002779, partial [Enterococcus faecium]|nr:hypothetical protein [Enterococcus faecium]
KSVRSVASAMSFIMMDGQSHALLDIVENRALRQIVLVKTNLNKT